jgi:hypothetical protein
MSAAERHHGYGIKNPSISPSLFLLNHLVVLIRGFISLIHLRPLYITLSVFALGKPFQHVPLPWSMLDSLLGPHGSYITVSQLLYIFQVHLRSALIFLTIDAILILECRPQNFFRKFTPIGNHSLLLTLIDSGHVWGNE